LKNNISNKQTAPGCFILFIIPFLLVGIATLYIGLSNLYFQIETNDWVPVKAKIIDVEIVATSSGGGRVRGGGGTSYETKCNYRYSYKNIKHTNNIISIGYGNNNTENHQELYAILKYASTITAYVNPENPNNSTLVKGINSSTTSLLIFSILWNGFVLFFFVKKNVRKFTFIFAVIFISGLIVIISGVSHTNFKKRINIIEKKSEKEIEEMKGKELKEIIEKYGSDI